MALKVHVVGRSLSVEQMFAAKGWQIAASPRETISLLCYTGGDDIEPSLYKERDVACRTSNQNRDYLEIELFHKSLHIPKVGICRGAQLLNVESGGKLWQDVNGHFGNHEAVDLLSGSPLEVTSTHHQMMRAGEKAEIIAVADKATLFVHDGDDKPPSYDPEVIWYDHTNSLCFQPHPEYGQVSHNHCRNYFYDLLEFFWGYQSPR